MSSFGIDRVSVVTRGEKVRIKEPPYSGRLVEHEVQPACADKNNGRWYCVTHGEGFPNQMQKDSHIGEYGDHGPNALHRLVWLCFEHGAEVP
jgi:hypothetical protein